MRWRWWLIGFALVSCMGAQPGYTLPQQAFALAAIPLSAPEIPNPGRGLYRWQDQQYLCAASFDNYRRWRWVDVEPAPGQYDWTPIQAELAAAEARGQRTWIGLAMATVPGETTLPPDMQRADWGAWQAGAWYPNYNHPAVRQRLEALLDAFAAAFPADQRIAGIQMRAYGQFGEIYIPWDTPPDSPIWASEATARWLVDAWHTRLSARYRLSIALTDQHSDDPATRNNNRFIFQYALTKAPAWGWFRDAVGHAEQMASVERAMASEVVIDGVAIGPALRDRWQSAPVFGEMVGGLLERGDEAARRPAQFALARAQVPRYHMALLGNGNFVGEYHRAPFNTTAAGCSSDAQSAWSAQDQADFAAAGKLAGYRYQLDSVALSQAGGQLQIDAQWRNSGVAPTYDPWTIQFQLRHAGQIVWEGRSALDLRTLLPGEPLTQTDRWPLPAQLDPALSYELHVALPAFIPDVSYLQPMQLASSGWQPATQTHLLGTVTLRPAP